jgi:hypothetical protein
MGIMTAVMLAAAPLQATCAPSGDQPSEQDLITTARLFVGLASERDGVGLARLLAPDAIADDGAGGTALLIDRINLADPDQPPQPASFLAEMSLPNAVVLKVAAEVDPEILVFKFAGGCIEQVSFVR